MNPYKTDLMTKALGLLSASAFVALTSLPGIAQSPMTDRNSDRMTNQMDRAEQGPSTVPGEGFPGPSEPPSGSPSVPGVSPADDPSLSNPQPLRRQGQDDSGVNGQVQDDSNPNGSRMNDSRMDDSGMNDMNGPSTVPNQGMPGPSESPSGSPSVPGNSSVDDPSLSQPGTSGQRRSDRSMNQQGGERDGMDNSSVESGSIFVPANSVPGETEGSTSNRNSNNTSENYSGPQRILRIPSSENSGSGG